MRAAHAFCVLTLGAVACSPPRERLDTAAQGVVVGPDDLIPVERDGANVPAKYRPLLDAFGLASNDCTVTHVGGGIVVSAGHCFDAPSNQVDDMACDGTTVAWGRRADGPGYLTSECVSVLAAEQSADRDYAIFRVSPIPPAKIEIDASNRPAIGRTVTIFGHPNLQPLEWSQTCTVQPASNGSFGADQFAHQCDTQPGSSGSSILDDTTLAVVGIHDGGTYPWNYATFLAGTPIAEVLAPTGAGHAWYATATPVLPIVPGNSACTTLTVTRSGSAAAVRLEPAGHDEDRSSLQATLSHGGRTVAAFDLGSFPAGRGVYALRGQPIGGFTGDARGDWQLCILATDPSGDAGTLDTWSLHD